MAHDANDLPPPSLGEHRADISRETFSRLRHFRRVLFQQGRPVLDADLNEQSAIVLHYLQCLAQDLGGPYFGSAGAFELAHAPAGGVFDFSISPGRYYAGGLLCENESSVRYLEQPYLAPERLGIAAVEGDWLIYLEAWERHVGPVEVSGLQEVALGPVDAAARSQVVWQVKLAKLDGPLDNGVLDHPLPQERLRELLWKAHGLLPDSGTGQLRAWIKPVEPDDEGPCSTAAAARYRGPENQLYRVEVHRCTLDGTFFKWSRENSSVYLPIKSIAGKRVTVEHLGRDAQLGVRPLDWVEVTSAMSVASDPRPPLLQVESVEPDSATVVLSANPEVDAEHAVLRRWDQRASDPSGCIRAEIVEPGPSETWHPLEDGIEVQFTRGAGKVEPSFKAGDFWLIPARVATADIEWPREGRKPLPVSPRGIVRHYAPLGVAAVNGGAPSVKNHWRKP